jgi:spore coat protein U-like protein
MKSKQLNGRVIRMVVASALALGSSALGVNSYAGTASANLSVTATVAPSCKISTTSLNFLTYDPIVANAATPLNGTGTVSVTCTSGMDHAATITLGEGITPKSGSSAALPQRQMTGPGGSHLSYALFKDAARSMVWSSAGVSHVGTGLQEIFTVYGSVDQGQNVPVGDYSDTVQAIITF